MPALRSSNLASADWQATDLEGTGPLFVTFKSGSTYRYEGVDEATYQGLLAAPSAGSYFASVIKDAYPTERVS